MSNWQIKTVKTNDKSEFTIYQNGRDVVKAKFTDWDQQNKKKATKIKITSSSEGRKILGINYCPKLDVIEIHYTPDNNDLGSDWALSGCLVNCIRVSLVEYSDSSSSLDLCAHNGISPQPEYKKGNIIIGNP